MPFAQATLDSINALGAAPGGVVVRPFHQDGTFRAYWEQPDGFTHEAEGATEAEALDNLLLVMQGNGDQVDQAIRLRKALALEAERQSALDAAVAEREAIEAER